MTILVTGATGLAGSEVLRQALNDPRVDRVIALVRRSTNVTNPKLTEIIHENFNDYTKLADTLKTVDGCVWALGISQTQVSKSKYIEITYDFAIEAAKALFAANPNANFCFLSGQGADQTEKAFSLFGKIKGRTEKDLANLNTDRVFSFRPGYIRPAPDVKPRLIDKFWGPVANVFEIFTDQMSVSSVKLAKAMIGVAKSGKGNPLFDNADIRLYPALKL